ncbi:TIR domain-containing protein [Pseudomonadota bacterium]
MNSKFKFKAYISYSHRDERWAKWLHRALESYRVPRKLVGTKTAVGKVPSRIKPVFRDRDDLSSASDLGGTVKQALADSENMIVVCSPDAAASFWVNEEIRQFASLGRQKQIFCVIVDGEPATPEAESSCFPAALVEIGLNEPLAADIRKWADGKRLSKLKLVAGMLGLPLDQLRRRDLQKRQKVWTLMTIATIALAAILVTAVTARIAAQQRRDSGESLVTYKLKQLRTMLNVADDPENLGRLKEWNEQDLDELIGSAGVNINARTEYALALREEGIEFWQNGNLTVALEKFQQSWALLAAGYRDDRSNHLLFFELGQAEYWIGQTYLDQGNLDAAEKAFMSYAEITRRLILLQPENAEWVLEMAYALTGLGNLQKSRDEDNPDRTLQFMQSSLEYNQIALVLDPANEYYQSELGQSHAFLADAQLDVCDLEGALKSRQEHVTLDSALLEAEPDDIDRIQRMVFALTGFASVKDLHGDIDEAMASLEKALELLEKILQQNVDARETAVDILSRQQYLVRFMILNGETDAALEAFNEISAKWLDLKGISEEDMRTSLIYVEHLTNQARLAETRGDIQQANQLLNDIRLHLVASQSNISFKRHAGNMLVEAVFLQWEMNGELPPANILSHLPEYVPGSGRSRACVDASRAAIKALMLGQLVQAREFTDYLLERGYREVGFMRVCKQYSLCSGQ